MAGCESEIMETDNTTEISVCEAKYFSALKKKIRETFLFYIRPEDILPYFHYIDDNVLTEQNMVCRM